MNAYPLKLILFYRWIVAVRWHNMPFWGSDYFYKKNWQPRLSWCDLAGTRDTFALWLGLKTKVLVMNKKIVSRLLKAPPMFSGNGRSFALRDWYTKLWQMVNRGAFRPCHSSIMTYNGAFRKNRSSLCFLTIFAKISIIDAWHGFKNVSG